MNNEIGYKPTPEALRFGTFGTLGVLAVAASIGTARAEAPAMPDHDGGHAITIDVVSRAYFPYAANLATKGEGYRQPCPNGSGVDTDGDGTLDHCPTQIKIITCTPESSATPIPTERPCPTCPPAETATPTATAIASVTVIATERASATPTVTATEKATDTATPTATDTATPTTTATAAATARSWPTPGATLEPCDMRKPVDLPKSDQLVNVFKGSILAGDTCVNKPNVGCKPLFDNDKSTGLVVAVNGDAAFAARYGADLSEACYKGEQAPNGVDREDFGLQLAVNQMFEDEAACVGNTKFAAEMFRGETASPRQEISNPDAQLICSKVNVIWTAEEGKILKNKWYSKGDKVDSFDANK